MDADDLILVSSPGIGVVKASDLPTISPDHVWATTHGFDFIQIVAIVAWYETDPMDPGIGTRTFAQQRIPDSTNEHSDYWTGDYSNDPIRRRISAITTGQYALVVN